jgi:hypothetical protein
MAGSLEFRVEIKNENVIVTLLGTGLASLCFTREETRALQFTSSTFMLGHGTRP